MSDKDPMRDWSFFAVFDGHAGSCAAEDASEKILHTLMEMPHFTQVRIGTENKILICFENNSMYCVVRGSVHFYR